MQYSYSILLALLLVCAQQDASESSETATEKINEILENILGYSFIQSYYDELTFYHVPVNGTQLINQIANDFGTKFFNRISAVKDLKATVRDSITNKNEQEECCHLDMQHLEVDERFKKPIRQQSCQRISSSASSPLSYVSKKFEKECAKNLEKMPWLRWQYFCSETGITTLYPAVHFKDCDSYDARYRPFYVHASVPEPKDLVIILDTSGSMEKLHFGETIMDIAKRACQTVVDTLNPKDRVAVIGFSSSVTVMGSQNRKESCFKSEFAVATSENTESINLFIRELKMGGTTEYGIALKKAFDYFSSDKSTGREREKVILFMSDGEPTDAGGGESILKILRDRNKQLNNSVIVMTYGLGDTNDYSILKTMASQNGSMENVKVGLFTQVKDPSDLRKEMASYYNFFSKRSGKTSDPIWTLPYLDMWGIGTMMSAVLPVRDDDDNILGVVGTDITMEDLLSGAIYFRITEYSYIFVIDAEGLVIYHPLFKYPEDYLIKYVDVLAYEKEEEMVKVIQDMKRGGSGSASFMQPRIFPEGPSKLYGVRSSSIMSEIYWRQIPHTEFSVCIVLAKGDTSASLQNIEPPGGATFLYHRLDLVQPRNPCSHFNNYGSLNQSTVSLGPRAFTNPSRYIESPETEEDVKNIVRFMETGKGGNLIKAGIRDSVWSTYQAEKYWLQYSNSDLEQYLIWRSIGTKEGIIRMYPGSNLPKEFDSASRPWYQNALANRGKVAFSAPYQDAVSGELVVSISKAIFEGKKSRKHVPSKDEVIAVVVADILLPYFRTLFGELYPDCAYSENYKCTLIDSSGFVIISHRNGSSVINGITAHITQVEPLLAESLINNRIMTRDDCLQVDRVRVTRSFKINRKKIEEKNGYETMLQGGCSNYQIIPVPGSNVYMIINIPKYSCSSLSPCQCSSFTSSAKERNCITDGSVCECPCSASYNDYNTCSNKYNFERMKVSPKPCYPESNTFYDVPKFPKNFCSENLPTCTKHSKKCELPPAGTSVGLVVGCCIAGIAIIIIIVVFVIWLKKKRKKEEESKAKDERGESIYVDIIQGPCAVRQSITSEPLPSLPPSAPPPEVYKNTHPEVFKDTYLVPDVQQNGD